MLLLCLLHFTCLVILFNTVTITGFKVWSGIGRLPRNHKIGSVNRGAGPEFDWKKSKAEAEVVFNKSVDSLSSKYHTIRATGASVSMIEGIIVKDVPTTRRLNQIATITLVTPLQLKISPFNQSHCKNIEEAVNQSGLSLTVAATDDQGIIKISVPMTTEERRKELVKHAKVLCEETKISIRNERRDVVERLKKLEKNKAIGKDVSKTCQDDIQSVAEKFNNKLEDLFKSKEKELMKV